MGTSIGMLGSARAQYHLRQCCVYLNMYPLNRPEVMIPLAAERFDADGNLIDDKSRELIAQLLQSLVQWTQHLKK
jgi:chromate reductase, NAD(P)H dehydrogenase (quinone)